MLILFEQREEVGEPEYETIVTNECLRTDTLVDLLFADEGVLNVVDGQGWDDQIELL